MSFRTILANKTVPSPLSGSIVHRNQQHLAYKASPLTLRRNYPSRPNPNQQQLKVWPFVLIFLVGTGAYVSMVKARAKDPPKARGPSITPK